MVLDVRPKNLTGAQLEEALDYVGITSNKNMIPFDPAKPMVTSGVRLGTTAVTEKGMKENEMIIIGNIINEVAENINDMKALDAIKERVFEFGSKFPLNYPEYYEAE